MLFACALAPLSQAQTAPDAPLQADKRIYDVSAVASLAMTGLSGQEFGTLTPVAQTGWLVAVRATDHALLSASLTSGTYWLDDSDLPTIYEPPTTTSATHSTPPSTTPTTLLDPGPPTVGVGPVLAVGGDYAPLGTGLHGPRLGARLSVAPASLGSQFVSPSRNGVRLGVIPHVGLAWIGHPGITLGVDAGASAVLCCEVLEGEPRLGGYVALSVGWSVAPGTPIPRSVDVLAALDAEDAARRRTLNHAVAVAVPVVAGAGALTAIVWIAVLLGEGGGFVPVGF